MKFFIVDSDKVNAHYQWVVSDVVEGYIQQGFTWNSARDVIFDDLGFRAEYFHRREWFCITIQPFSALISVWGYQQNGHCDLAIDTDLQSRIYILSADSHIAESGALCMAFDSSLDLAINSEQAFDGYTTEILSSAVELRDEISTRVQHRIWNGENAPEVEWFEFDFERSESSHREP